MWRVSDHSVNFMAGECETAADLQLSPFECSSRCAHCTRKDTVSCHCFLWPHYGIGQAIIFLPCGFFLSFFCLSFFPRLISAAADRMSTIVPHVVWSSANLECRCEICCTRLAGNTGRKKSPFWHHRTTLSGYIFGTKACIDNRINTC